MAVDFNPNLREMCPSDDTWTGLAAGLIQGSQANHALAHASGCETCAQLLREATAVLGDLDCQPVEPLTPQRRRELARWMARSGGGFRWDRFLVGVAAVAILAVGAELFLTMHRPDRAPFGIAESAYSQHRMMDLRISGAAYGPVHQIRGGSSISDAPPELLHLLALARGHKSASNKGEWLHLEGQTEILLGQYEAAIESLRAAAAAGADVALDAATARFQREEASGTPAGRAEAIKLMEQAVAQHPNDASGHFNFAVALDKSGATEAAVREYRAALQLETDARWRSEIQDRLNRLLEQR
jgi:tetratricopeptide (TPR) repeat protein